MTDTATREAIEATDYPVLQRIVDGHCAARDWEALADLRDPRCKDLRQPVFVGLSADYGMNKYPGDMAPWKEQDYSQQRDATLSLARGERDMALCYHCNQEQLFVAQKAFPIADYPHQQIVTVHNTAAGNPVTNGWYQNCLFFLIIYVTHDGKAPSRDNLLQWPDGADRTPVSHSMQPVLHNTCLMSLCICIASAPLVF